MVTKKERGRSEENTTQLPPMISLIREGFGFAWDIGKTLFLVVAIAFVIRFYLVQPFYVEGQSMEPNFNDGEYLLIDELSYRFRDPDRGEVIVFKPHISTYQNYIKRIIGLPYEKVEFDQGVIIYNDDQPEGARLKEQYLPPQYSYSTNGDTSNFLKDNEFFVLGDNRTQSSDSRIFGPIAKQNIIGRVWLYIHVAPWKEFSIGPTKIKIPKIVDIGRVPKPEYPDNN